jgi:anti-sigma factor RsiW
LEQQSAFEETCERYLLGELSEAEREQFEESYFTDDSLFERFLAVKDELLDAYARGELDEEKRVRFARHFLAAAPRRRQLGEAQEFIRAVTAVSTKAASTDGAIADAPFSITPPEPSRRKSLANFFNLRRSAWQFAFAALLLITVGATLILVRLWQQQATRDELVAHKLLPEPTTAVTTAPLTDESDNTNVNNNTVATPSPTPANVNESPNKKTAPQPTRKKLPRRQIQNRQPQRAKTQSPVNDVEDTRFNLTIATVGRDPESIASITLMPVASRDINDENSIDLYSETRKVRLRLVFNNDNYRNYSATITTIEGASVWGRNKLKAKIIGGKKSVTLQFAPALLSQQDYIVTLTGQTAAGQTETIGEYYFHVERSSSTQSTPTQTPAPEL